MRVNSDGSTLPETRKKKEKEKRETFLRNEIINLLEKKTSKNAENGF